MATAIYKYKNIKLFNGDEIEVVPLKLKYLREFMDAFELVQETKNDEDAISGLTECVRVCMKQYHPEISKNIEDIEDNVDLPTIYEILDIAANIKINQNSSEPVKDQAKKGKDTWADFDLAKLEAQVFLLGIWKDYNELELSISLPELVATLEVSQELDYSEKKFLAAIQGVDLDNENGKGGQKEWEDMKARVFSQGATSDSNDVLALQGINAQQVGFGIGMGLDYEDGRDPSLML